MMATQSGDPNRTLNNLPNVPARSYFSIMWPRQSIREPRLIVPGPRTCVRDTGTATLVSRPRLPCPFRPGRCRCCRKVLCDSHAAQTKKGRWAIRGADPVVGMPAHPARLNAIEASTTSLLITNALIRRFRHGAGRTAAGGGRAICIRDGFRPPLKAPIERLKNFSGLSDRRLPAPVRDLPVVKIRPMVLSDLAATSACLVGQFTRPHGMLPAGSDQLECAAVRRLITMPEISVDAASLPVNATCSCRSSESRSILSMS